MSIGQRPRRGDRKSDFIGQNFRPAGGERVFVEAPAPL